MNPLQTTKPSGLTRDEDGIVSGLDPREMSAEQLNALGHEKSRIISVIRAKCLDCCNGMVSEVRHCTSVACALWPYRMNTNPFSEREISDEQREAAAERFAAHRAAKKEAA